MKFKGTVEIEKVSLTDLKGNEAKCSECMQPFKEGDNITILVVTKAGSENIIPFEDPYIVHIKHPQNDTSCLEDFIARLTNTLTTHDDKKNNAANGAANSDIENAKIIPDKS